MNLDIHSVQFDSLHRAQNKLYCQHQHPTIFPFGRKKFPFWNINQFGYKCSFDPKSEPAATHKGENAHKIIFHASKKLNKNKNKTSLQETCNENENIKLGRNLARTFQCTLLHFTDRRQCTNSFPNLTSDISTTSNQALKTKCHP